MVGPKVRIDMTANPGSWSSEWLALRSLLWMIVLPGVVVGYVPWRFFGVGRTPVDLWNPGTDSRGRIVLYMREALM
jgi:hypothetical protein